MSFFDDILPIGGAIVGGVAGSFFGNPMLGASLGGSLGGMAKGALTNGGNPEGLSADQVAAYQKLLGELPTYQGPQPGQGLTAQDTAAMETARRSAQQFAQGREGALMQQDAATSGGTSRSGKLLAAQMGSSQAATDRLNSFDLGEAGIAADRDAQNRMALNDFNQRNMMMKLGVTGGEVGSMQHQQDLAERDRYANNQNMGNLFSTLGASSLFKMGGDGADDYINKAARFGQYDAGSIGGSGI